VLVRTGVEASILPETEKAALRTRIDEEFVGAAREAGVDL
jgi:hypothetical protein